MARGNPSGKSLKNLAEGRNKRRERALAISAATRKVGKSLFSENTLKSQVKTSKSPVKQIAEELAHRERDYKEMASLQKEIDKLTEKVDIEGKILKRLSEEEIGAIEHKLEFLERRLKVLKQHTPANSAILPEIAENYMGGGGRRSTRRNRRS